MGLRKRSGQQAGAFFITTSTDRMFKRFQTDSDYNIVLTNIEFYRKREDAQIYAFVVMPNHIHLLMGLPQNGSIINFMRDLKKRIAHEYFELHDMPPCKFWQDRFDDVNIFSRDVYNTKLKYIHENPMRAGLAGNISAWKYSSAPFYIDGVKGIVEIYPMMM